MTLISKKNKISQRNYKQKLTHNDVVIEDKSKIQTQYTDFFAVYKKPFESRTASGNLKFKLKKTEQLEKPYKQLVKEKAIRRIFEQKHTQQIYKTH